MGDRLSRKRGPRVGNGMWQSAAEWTAEQRAEIQARTAEHKRELATIEKRAELAREAGYQQALTEVAPELARTRIALAELAARLGEDAVAGHEVDLGLLKTALGSVKDTEDRVFGKSTQKIQSESKNMHLHLHQVLNRVREAG